MDSYWKDAINFVSGLDDQIINVVAPKEFSTKKIYVHSEVLDMASFEACSIFIIHKGEMDKHDINFLKRMSNELFPIFGNEVFVIFGPKSLKFSGVEMKHVEAFLDKFKHVLSRGLQKIEQTKSRPMAYLGNNKALTKTVFGHKIIVDTRDISLAPHILLDGEWEAWNTKVFLGFVKPGMCVVDVGSNVGFYSLLAADRIGSNGSLTCFEANPELASILFRNLYINEFYDRSEVINKAVYSHSAKLNFKIYENYMGSSSLWASDEIAVLYHDRLKTIEVEAISLDEHFNGNKTIDLIKIDAEGTEPYILKGAKRIIKNNPDIIIIMEFAPSVIEVSYGSAEQFYEDIHNFGLNIYEIKTDSTLSHLSLDRIKEISVTDVVLKK